MDAFELLKKDHQKVSQLFSEIESASGQSKIKLFDQLKSELDLHAHIEETVLYPALENTDEAREITLEAYEEHNVVKDLLRELASSDKPNDQWDAKLTVLKENVEHHVKEEEGELFDKARKALGDERIETLGTELEAEKARQTGAQPRAAATKKAAASKNAKKESPGVLQRLASFIGLAETPAPTGAGRRKSATTGNKSGAKTTAAKSPSKTKSPGRSSVTASASAKSAKASSKAASKRGKTTAKKAAKKSASKARTSNRATSAKKATPSRARTSASKSAARPASNQKVKPAGRDRKGSKSSTKSSTKTRGKSR